MPKPECDPQTQNEEYLFWCYEAILSKMDNILVLLDAINKKK